VVTSGLYAGVSLEALVDSAGLAGASVKAVKKTLVMDLLASGWDAALDKAEGVTIINDSTIAFCNDNDFGQSCPLANGIPVATSNLSHIVVFNLKGADKIQNFVAAKPLSISAVKETSTAVKLYPNPSADLVTLSLTLNKEERVGISIMDMQGKTAMEPLVGDRNAGEQAMELNVSQLPNGIYFVRVAAGDTVQTIKMVVIH
jgi:hypothetical protein